MFCRVLYLSALLQMIFCVVSVSEATLSAADVLDRDFDSIHLGGSRFVWDCKKYGSILTSLCQDKKGNLWVGTEDKGIWMLDIKSGNIICLGRSQEQNADYKDENKIDEKLLLEDGVVYALACDRQGRIWAGHCSSGVSVFNGESWKNYNVLSGPLGERIFDIKVNPADGDIWIASSLGLARYREATDDWCYYSRANGMPSDQVYSLAFDEKGKILFAGTQCDGIAIGKLDSNSNEVKWEQVDGPVRMPLAHKGKGLPSGRINQLAIAPDGSVYAATDTGLAIGNKKGEKWEYLRGRDLLKKAELMYIPLHVDSKLVAQSRKSDLQQRAQVLKLKADDFKFDEDYISSINIDPDGKLWLGQREKGYCVYDPKVGRVIHSTKDDLDMWGKTEILVSQVFFPNNGAPILALYGKGLLQSSQGFKKKKQSKKLNAAEALPEVTKHPSPAKAPDKAQLQKMIDQILVEQKPLMPGDARYVGEDWQTKGDWVGRYGRQFAVLSAQCAPINHYPTVIRTKDYWVKERMGPHIEGNDSIRYWVCALSNNLHKTLYNPILKLRRQSEWDDHGESYDINWEGPDIWLEVTVPEGVQQLTLCFVNYYTAEERGYIRNIYRNYIVSVKEHLPIDEAHYSKPLAKARVIGFEQGVYKSFLLRGPSKYWVHIHNNYSYNCQISGVFIDQLKGMLIDDSKRSLQYVGYYRAPKYKFDYEKQPKEALMLWKYLLNSVYNENTSNYRRIWQRFCLRNATKNKYPEPLLSNMRWKNFHWVQKDRETYRSVIMEDKIKP